MLLRIPEIQIRRITDEGGDFTKGEIPPLSWNLMAAMLRFPLLLLQIKLALLLGQLLLLADLLSLRFPLLPLHLQRLLGLGADA